MQAGDTFQRGGEGGRLGEITYDDFHTRREVCFGGVTGQRPNVMTRLTELFDQMMPNPTSCACDQDFHRFSLR
jgi:hypothetical protein